MDSISILTPTYEPDPRHLREAIESVLAQSEKDWTLLIHDDASSSEVRSIVEPYLADPRITFVRSERRLGIGGNWNACLRSVDASFVQFLFQDDAWEPEYLATGLSILREHPSVGMVSLGYHYQVEAADDTQQFYDQIVSEKAPFLTPGEHDGRAFLTEWAKRGMRPCIPGEPSFVMLRTETVRKAGMFLEDMPQFLDCEYWARMLLQGNWYVQPGAFGFFRVHEASASMQNGHDGIGLYDRLRCLERVRSSLPSESREGVDAYFIQNLAAMMQKFFRRSGSGKSVSTRGSGAVVTFALRHPLLVVRAFLSAISRREVR